MTGQTIYHIATEADYCSRNDGQVYLPPHFDTGGFVHCALEASVLPVANDYYVGISDTLLLLKIDPSRLKSPMRYEPASPAQVAATLHVASSPVFPHVYGPIDNVAVDGIGILAKTEHGYTWPATFVSLAKFFGRVEASSA